MTIKEAYEIAKKDYPCDGYLVGCSEFPDFWGFIFAAEKNGLGGAYWTVDKKDGHVDVFNPTENLELFRKRKKIPLDEVLD